MRFWCAPICSNNLFCTCGLFQGVLRCPEMVSEGSETYCFFKKVSEWHYIVGRRFTYQASRVVLEPISWNRQQHCFKILWSFNFCPSGVVHRWSMVATLGVRRMALQKLVIQSLQIRFHFRFYFSKKIR